VSSTPPLLGVLVLTLAAASVAPAQGSTADPLATQLRRCAALAAAGPRLACYDALAGNLAATGTGAAASPAASESSGAGKTGKQTAATNTGAATNAGAAKTSVAASEAQSPNFANFGVRNGPLEATRDPVREKRMLAVVSAVSSRARGELVVTLDNGQVWAQIQPADYPLKPGDHVEIDVAALGSYRLWSPSTRRATKVTRVK
jgi:hypothetical protein